MLVKSTSLMHDDDDGNRGHVMAYILYTTWHNPSVHVWNHQCSSCIEKTLIQTIPLPENNQAIDCHEKNKLPCMPVLLSSARQLTVLQGASYSAVLRGANYRAVL